MNDIEIGISIDAKLYLHIVGNDLPTQFEVPRIINVEDKDGLTVLSYLQPQYNDCSEVIITEKADDVTEAMNSAVYYKDEALKKINELLEHD